MPEPYRRCRWAKGYDLFPQDLIAIWRSLVTEGARAHADNLQGSLLAQSARGR